MPSFSVPWVIGPVPIVATIWSAYVTTAALVRRREMTGERFVAAFLFPLGIIAASSLMFLLSYDLRIVLIAGQLLTAICFIATFILEKKLRGDPAFMPTEEMSLKKLSATLYFIAIIYFIFCAITFNFPVFSACSITKCYVLELLFGGKAHKFAVLYSVNFVGSLILVGAISILFLIISRVQTKN
ncbi:hypothetical protein HFO98_25505 [Rhizobium leguminosarum]|uniref:hypothetical protein n=1 Tax=Rhizobium leguminosarum TaxID=384 RepID=UPI001C9620E6|nr:hypothetical protein [Rhizobium leguminosarum]MBY5411752.1 hypothetical protein [Rhizobium leguminosarum]